MNTINRHNLHAYAKGASCLGSGGGGDTDELLPMVIKKLETYGNVPIIQDLENDDIVLPIELVGAPIPLEMRHTLHEFLIRSVVDKVKEHLKVKAIMPVEIGGSNALTPLCVAGELGLPLYDGDLLGRAFPDIYLTSTNLFDRHPDKAYIGNPITGEIDILSCTSFDDLEKQARHYAMQNSMTCAVLIPLVLTGREVKQMAIQESVSKALSLGEGLLNKTLPKGCHVWFEGGITSWTYKIENGFLKGELAFESGFEILVRNEYMVLKRGTKECAKAPKIITLLDSATYTPILSDQIKVGNHVTCISFKGPDLWSTQRGIKLIGKSLKNI